MRSKLSVALATFNEAENIARCLKSVQSIADEIIIVDGSSTDNTRDIAKKFDAKVIKTSNKSIFHINKQMAVDACKGDWILTLDADEEVSPDLAQEISQVIQMSESEIRDRAIGDRKRKLFDRHTKLLEARDGNFNQTAKETTAFFIPRLNMFLGHPMKYGGVYPDGVIRLIKRDKARFPAKSVHEQIQVDGRVDWLENDLLHYDSPTFSKYLMRANRYTSLTAEEFKKKNLKINLLNSFYYLILKPKFVFLKMFFRHKGILDGFPGFVFALFSGLHFSIAYMKYWDLKGKKSSK